MQAAMRPAAAAGTNAEMWGQQRHCTTTTAAAGGQELPSVSYLTTAHVEELD